jgi:hypothetical protein
VFSNKEVDYWTLCKNATEADSLNKLLNSMCGEGPEKITDLKLYKLGNWTVHQPFIDFKKAYDSVKREVLYNILLEFGIPKKIVRLIKMCLNETYSKIRVDKLL